MAMAVKDGIKCPPQSTRCATMKKRQREEHGVPVIAIAGGTARGEPATAVTIKVYVLAACGLKAANELCLRKQKSLACG